MAVSRTQSLRPHPEEARSAVSKDGGGLMLRDAALRAAPQHEAEESARKMRVNALMAGIQSYRIVESGSPLTGSPRRRVAGCPSRGRTERSDPRGNHMNAN